MFKASRLLAGGPVSGEQRQRLAVSGLRRQRYNRQVTQYRLCGIEVMGIQISGKCHHAVMPIVSTVEHRDPIERIGKQASHTERLGVP